MLANSLLVWITRGGLNGMLIPATVYEQLIDPLISRATNTAYRIHYLIKN